MRQGFLYLIAIIDWATRRVLSWRLSNTLTAGFCVEALSEALGRFGKPGIFNTEVDRFRGARQAFNGGFSDAQDASALFT
jgi:putative transposase